MLRTIHTVTLHVLSVFLFLKGEEDSYLIFNFVLLSCLGCSNVNLGEKVLWCSVSQLTFARLYKINMFVFNAISFFCNYHLEFSDSSVAA